MRKKDNLYQLVGSINTREDFVFFVQELVKDLDDNPLEWENDSLGRYLLAIAAWTHDMDGYYKNINQPLPKNVNWKIIGQVLLAAKLYE